MDLAGGRLPGGGQGSAEARLLAYRCLKQAGIDPKRDLAANALIGDSHVDGDNS